MPDEILAKSLGSGLSAQLPIALYSRDGRTLGQANETALDGLRDALEAVDLDGLSASDEALRLADVVIAWNILKHGYPYFDVVGVNWDDVLSSTIEDALDDGGADDFILTLQRMIAKLEDGHGSIGHPLIQNRMSLPVLPALVEDTLVAVAVTPSSPFQIGDVIVSLDGEPALDRLEREMALGSGTERWRRHRALRAYESGEPQSVVHITVERDGELVDLEATRNHAAPIFENRPENIEDHQVLQHLTDQPLQSAHFNVPKMIYPDQEDVVSYTTGRWMLLPLEPRFQGKTVFLIDERAISYSESVMGIVEAYELGEIVGQPTAGTNGNINRIMLPGEFIVVFTGMRVLKHDSTRHHLVGIHPTIPAQRTLAGIRENRDEFLEKALDTIRK